MQRRAQIAMVLAVLMAAPNVSGAEYSTKNWSQLSQNVRSEWTVRLVLPDATVVEGRGARFAEDSLALKVTKTSNQQTHPKGALTVPRSSVKTLELRRNRIRGQVLGLTVPLAAGAVVGGVGGSKGVFEGGGLMVTGVALGIAAIPLFFLGRASDRHWESITIMP